VVAATVRPPADLGAARRHCHLACGRADHRPAGDFAALAGIQFNKGDVMFAAALLVFGLYSALMLRRPKMNQLSLISFTTGCGALLLLPFSIWEFSTGFTLKFDALTMATLIYVVIFPSTLAYLFFNRGIALIGPNRAAPFFHLVPVFGSAMAILLLGEQPRLFHLMAIYWCWPAW
jgi:drug/metabolite transporter (DMT)-like permease